MWFTHLLYRLIRFKHKRYNATKGRCWMLFTWSKRYMLRLTVMSSSYKIIERASNNIGGNIFFIDHLLKKNYIPTNNRLLRWRCLRYMTLRRIFTRHCLIIAHLLYRLTKGWNTAERRLFLRNFPLKKSLIVDHKDWCGPRFLFTDS